MNTQIFTDAEWSEVLRKAHPGLYGVLYQLVRRGEPREKVMTYVRQTISRTFPQKTLNGQSLEFIAERTLRHLSEA